MNAGNGALIDLHLHTHHRSSDSGLAPHAAARAALRLGLTALCITEHNATWTADEARALQEQHGLPVIRGMEVSTDAGHVLTFGLERYRPELFAVERLRRVVEAEGGAMVLAHPLRSPGFGRSWEEAPQLFEALECLNGDDSNGTSEFVFAIAERQRLGATGGSDAHSQPAVGRCATRFEEAIRDERELIAALRAGAMHPVLHHPAHARYHAHPRWPVDRPAERS